MAEMKARVPPPFADVTGIKTHADHVCVPAAETRVRREFHHVLRIRRLYVNGAPESRVAHGCSIARTPIDYHVADIHGDKIAGRVVREIVRVAPWNAVERDIELAILKAADRRRLVLHQARAVGIDRK